MRRTRKRLHEEVGAIGFGWNIDGRDVAVGDGIADEVMTNINMFGSGMELRVVSESDGTLVVGMDNGRVWLTEFEFVE